MPVVVGTGLVALDVLLHDDCTHSETALGGSTGNVLAILAFFGWSAFPVARLGKDGAARRIESEFSALKVDTRFLTQDKNTTTPIVFQSQSEAGAKHYFSFSCPACGAKRGFVPGQGDEHCTHVLEQIGNTAVFYFDRVTPWALNLARAYRQRGTLVMFEPSRVETDRAAFQQAITLSNILKYADDRIDDLATMDLQGLDVEIQTAGAKGLRFRRLKAGEQDWSFLNALPVASIADTSGSGDWRTAGLLYALSKTAAQSPFSHDSLLRSLKYGQMLAALNCMLPGARGLARSFEKSFTHAQLAVLLDGTSPNHELPGRWDMVKNEFQSRLRSYSADEITPVDQVGKGQPIRFCCSSLDNN